MTDKSSRRLPTMRNLDGSAIGFIKKTSWSPEDLREDWARRDVIEAKLGFDRVKDEADPAVRVRHVCQVVTWAHAYAPPDSPFDESNPLWPEFSALCDWFKVLILEELDLPPETPWERIHECAGFIMEEFYESPERYLEAEYRGNMTRIRHPEAAEKLRELERVKFQNDGLI